MFVFFAIQVSTSEMLVSNAAQSLEEFYPSVAIATLMRIIRDPNLHQHHNQVLFTEYLSAS
jgi:FKBP12-rapamycin complex-associated protein